MEKLRIMKYLGAAIILLVIAAFSNCHKNTENIENTHDNLLNQTSNLIINSDELLWEEMKILASLINIDFSLYPTKNVWKKTECIPILNTELKLNYQTIIKNESKLEPNFDGKYRILSFGYGTGAQYFFIIDLNNGNVYEGRISSFGIKFDLNSSMIIINPIENITWDTGASIPKWLNIEYIRWNGSEFVGLLVLNSGINIITE